MAQISAFLFDLDGVIIDTEPQYDCFWRQIAIDYQLGIENFEYIIKGTTLPNILAKHFSHLSPEDQQKIEAANRTFDLQMDILPISGVMKFLDELKASSVKLGLVTSSCDEKLEYVFRELPIKHYFDTIVSANRITEGKPAPMCYLLAAKDLNLSPENCVVFEDSFNGIKSGKSAGMRVVGLSTTNPEESIQDDCVKVIPDFNEFKLGDIC